MTYVGPNLIIVRSGGDVTECGTYTVPFITVPIAGEIRAHSGRDPPSPRGLINAAPEDSLKREEHVAVTNSTVTPGIVIGCLPLTRASSVLACVASEQAW